MRRRPVGERPEDRVHDAADIGAIGLQARHILLRFSRPIPSPRVSAYSKPPEKATPPGNTTMIGQLEMAPIALMPPSA